MDIEDFNRRWLEQWTAKSVDGVLSFYHDDIEYYDEGVPAGLTGKAALGAYLTALFAQVPEWSYAPEWLQTIDGGFIGRWYMDMGTGAEAIRMRGFDHCKLKDDLIVFNEVYTHKFPPAVAAG
ncbi:nuclear transport factor 2 family protein [Novosphingobium sp. KCTC 2891]|uniref:nuclear transport factor 2 family protein n=1 Tax=Novosphingobium sp. KCTC 2891 TaxID=2989730 RepID=UPI00222395C0|nr:nuclear transport factor 2 family protein [Novosphingobium sp. KCTC 2891]MCW1381648.1 nuclear transport factor 2 family protein [Novosphingobium sp. KCTC 2891]